MYFYRKLSDCPQSSRSEWNIIVFYDSQRMKWWINFFSVDGKDYESSVPSLISYALRALSRHLVDKSQYIAFEELQTDDVYVISL